MVDTRANAKKYRESLNIAPARVRGSHRRRPNCSSRNPILTNCSSVSKWVRSPQGSKIQKKIWTETLDVLQRETGSFWQVPLANKIEEFSKP